jgi:hypothetical protein
MGNLPPRSQPNCQPPTVFLRPQISSHMLTNVRSENVYLNVVRTRRTRQIQRQPRSRKRGRERQRQMQQRQHYPTHYSAPLS